PLACSVRPRPWPSHACLLNLASETRLSRVQRMNDEAPLLRRGDGARAGQTESKGRFKPLSIFSLMGAPRRLEISQDCFKFPLPFLTLRPPRPRLRHLSTPK
ncbi:hypothetical protein JMJ77_0002376, partial [Colletotrichum scovillei]